MRSNIRSVAALGALALVACDVRAAITVQGVPVIRWGVSDKGVGFADGTLEDFEDVNLAPGLRVEWQAGAGNIGPVSVLPAAFDPVANDSFGNAFDASVWSGTHSLLSSRGNESHSYTDGTQWGDMVLHFDPPVRWVGFSMQQAEAEITLVVNGTSVGGLFTLANLPRSSGREGYIIVRATGTDTISTLELDNSGGDGFAIDRLKFSTQGAPAYDVRGYSGVAWGAPDSQLEMGPERIETFEDVNLEPGLMVEIETPVGNLAPTSVLPNTFAPVTDDNFGNAFDSGPWDGTRVLINTRDNRSHAYTGTQEWGDIAYHFDPPVRTVGFSYEQQEQVARIVINGRDVGELSARSGFGLGVGRHGYVRFTAPCSSPPISELRFNNGRISIGGDGIAFDHLAFGRCIADVDDGNGLGTCDGGVTIDDLIFFLGAFEDGDLRADVDDGSGQGIPDDGVTIDDLIYFLIRFEAGC